MAEKRPAEPRPKRGRPKSANPKPATPIVVTIRARPEWEAWLDSAREALAKRTGLAVKIERTEAIDAALALLGENLGIGPPPQRF